MELIKFYAIVMKGYDGKEKAYIATQGPLPNTVEDLYRMAWNEKSPIIVMITKFFEKAKVKCESYFPTKLNETVRYGDFQITVLDVTQKDGFSVRKLSIEVRVVIKLFIMKYISKNKRLFFVLLFLD